MTTQDGDEAFGPPADYDEVLIGEHVRDLRIARGLSQRQLGERMRPPMLQTTVTKLEAGGRPLRVKELRALANALDVDVLDLWPEASPDTEHRRERQQRETEVRLAEWARIARVEEALRVARRAIDNALEEASRGEHR